MKLRNVMLLNAVLAGLFGLFFLIFPDQVGSLYDVVSTPILKHLARMWGGVVIALSMIIWICRNLPESALRRWIVLGLMLGNGIGFVVSLLGQLEGLVNSSGWVDLVLYLILTGSYAYFFFRKS